jgi:hypothetical protein
MGEGNEPSGELRTVAGGSPGEIELFTDDERIDVLIELAKLKEEAEKREKAAKAEIDALTEPIVRYFQSRGQQKVTRRGKTAYLAREVWPKIKDDDILREVGENASKDELAEAKARASDRLIRALTSDVSTDHLAKITINHATLRSFLLNDCPEDPETSLPIIPEHLTEALTVSEQFKVKIVAGK